MEAVKDIAIRVELKAVESSIFLVISPANEKFVSEYVIENRSVSKSYVNVIYFILGVIDWIIGIGWVILCLMKWFYICCLLPIESTNLLLKEATSLPPPFSLSLSIPLSLSFSLSLYLYIYLSLSLSLSVTLSLILSMHSCLRICTHLNLINCLSSLSLFFPLSPYFLSLS